MVRKTETYFWTIFIDAENCVPLFVSSQKTAYHYFSQPKYWYARWWRCLRLVTLFTANFYSGSRSRIEKTSGPGTTILEAFLLIWKSIFGHLCIFWNSMGAKRFRSWKAIFWASILVIWDLFSRQKMFWAWFLSSGNPPLPEKTTPGRKGTGQREPWAKALTGKKWSFL